MSAACLFLPTTAHVAAGGAPPTDLGLIAAGGLLSVACVALADRRRSFGEIAVLLLMSQPMLHVLLTMAGHHPPGAEPVGSSASMVIAHLVAAGVLSVLLAGLEATMWSLAALADTVLLRARRLLSVPPQTRTSPARRRPEAPERRLAGVVLVRSTPWRGPPVVAGT